MKISQSLVKDIAREGVCGEFLRLRYIEKIDTEGTDAMKKGRYFEWHLLGATRDGIEPVYEPLGNGGKPAVQLELDSLILRARLIMQRLGVNIPKGEKQLRLETDLFVGHLDLVTNDFQNAKKGKMCIIDVKYTDTKYDDRWNGWGDAENNPDVQLQSTHYTMLYHECREEWVPFYYFVFGKSGWVRIIRIQITQDGIDRHFITLENTAEKLTAISSGGWKPLAEYNKCMGCPYSNPEMNAAKMTCKHRALLPVVENIVF